MKKAIAMKCTQEQYETIKPKLNELNKEIGGFERLPYLTNFIFGRENNIGNVFESCKGDYNREVFETWNKKVFLQACGIETEPEYVITKSEMDELKYLLSDDSHSGHHLRIEITKNILPHLFKEDKAELVPGNWYVYPAEPKFITYVKENGRRYGIGSSGFWFNDSDVVKDTNGYREATHEEITESLTKEAVKRGFKEGVYFRVPNSKTESVCGKSMMLNEWNSSILYFGDYCIFKDGLWAEIIPTISKEDAEKELGKKILN